MIDSQCFESYCSYCYRSPVKNSCKQIYSGMVSYGERFNLRPPPLLSPSFLAVHRLDANDDIRIDELPVFISVYCLHLSGAEEQDHRKNL